MLSVFWFVGFGWWLRHEDIDRAQKFAGYDMCSAAYDMMLEADVDGRAKIFHDCLDRAAERFKELYPPLWGTVAVDALSIGALWLLAWIALVVGRWIAAGFRQQA